MSKIGIAFVVTIAVIVVAGIGVYGLSTQSQVTLPMSTTGSQESFTSTNATSVNQTSQSSTNSSTSQQSCAYIIGSSSTYGNHSESVTNSTLGLELSFSYATNSTRCGQELQIPFELVNILPRVNNLSIGQDWVVPLTGRMCVNPPAPAYFVLFAGYYDYANVSKGTPIGFVYSCPAGNFTPEYYLFQPNSSIVDTYGYENGNFTSSGWDNDSSHYSTFFATVEYHWSSTGLPVGTYTLVIEDQWGQILVWNFQVTKVTT